MLRAVIIDDESSGISTLRMLLDRHVSQVKVVGETTRGRQGVSLIEDHRPEIVFLDIHMPDLDGFGVLQQLGFRDFNLVFTTAHQGYAIQAIRQRACDYLLKPVDATELKNCIGKIEAHGRPLAPGKNNGRTIGIAMKDGIVFVRHAEILRLEASGSYTIFHLGNNVTHIASKSLRHYESQLPTAEFYRCHHSHLVNLEKVVKVISNHGLFAQLTDGSIVEIARKNKNEFLARLQHPAE